MFKYLLLLVLFAGCSQIRPEFYDVVVSHKDLVNETNKAIILSISEELNRPNLSEDDRKNLNILKERLDFSIKQSNIILDYLNKKVVDEEFIAELIKYRWHKEQ